MPRNNQGVYTLPTGNPVVSQTLITDEWANGTMSDVANELTNSLDRTGRGGMQGAFMIIDGSASVPGLSFTNEPSSGLYRTANADWSLSVQGVQALELTAPKITSYKPLDVMGLLSANTPPAGDNSRNVATTAFIAGMSGKYSAGDIVSTFAASPPPGTLLCNGQAVSRTTYPKLFTAIGTKYGAGDGSTTFNVPAITEDDAFILTAIVANVGQRTAGVIKMHQHTGSTASTGSHNHGGATVAGGDHNHGVVALNQNIDGAHDVSNVGNQPHYWYPNTMPNSGPHAHTINADGTHNHTFTTDVNGGANNLAAGLRILVCIATG